MGSPRYINLLILTSDQVEADEINSLDLRSYTAFEFVTFYAIPFGSRTIHGKRFKKLAVSEKVKVAEPKRSEFLSHIKGFQLGSENYG